MVLDLLLVRIERREQHVGKSVRFRGKHFLPNLAHVWAATAAKSGGHAERSDSAIARGSCPTPRALTASISNRVSPAPASAIGPETARRPAAGAIAHSGTLDRARYSGRGAKQRSAARSLRR